MRKVLAGGADQLTCLNIVWFQMSKYHPIDVRYKGPSTAYRGSTHRKKNFEQRAEPARADGPWGKVDRSPPRQDLTFQRIDGTSANSHLQGLFAAIKRLAGTNVIFQVVVTLLVYLIITRILPDVSGLTPILDNTMVTID